MLYVILQVENVYPVITKMDKKKHELVIWKASKSSSLVIKIEEGTCILKRRDAYAREVMRG